MPYKPRTSRPRKKAASLPLKKPRAKRKRLSIEAREKMSETRTRQILDGSSKGGHSRGKHFSTKMNIEMVFRSSWEKKAFESLDKDETVLIFNSEPFGLEYYFKLKRHYIPDILIIYKDGTQKLIEIKPTRFINRGVNKAKFAAGRKYCEEKGMIFEIWTEKEIKELL